MPSSAAGLATEADAAELAAVVPEPVPLASSEGLAWPREL